jgi:hypothetical protein
LLYVTWPLLFNWLVDAEPSPGRGLVNQVGCSVSIILASFGLAAPADRCGPIPEDRSPIPVRAPRVDDRRTDLVSGERVRFRSVILPPWCRESPNFRVRLEQARLCCLVIAGVRADGTKELVAVADGERESTDSWAELLRDLRRRGMRVPVVAVGDGALGLWAALREVFPATRHQRDWVH